MFDYNLPEQCSIVGKWTTLILENYKFRSTQAIKDTRIITGIFAIILLFSVPLVVPSQAVLTDSSQTGVIIPLYTYPGNTWDEVIQVKNANPSIPIIAIINPNSGSGSSIDTNYETKIQELQSAEILVLGYVYTSYAQRTSAQAITEIDNYKNWYNVDGIFFDEMSNIAGDENYYQNLDDYVKSQGLSYTVGNPGTDTLPSYVGTVDNIIIYENSGLPDISSINGWHENYEKKNCSLLTHELNAIDSAFCVEASNYVGYLYFTNDILPNPWDSLPPYFDELVAKMNIVIDTASPVITLNGANPVTLEAGIDTYTEDGASVTDDDPTYTGIVSIGGDTVYANTVGTYIVTYDAPADAAGNVPLQITRTVNVIDTTATLTVNSVDLVGNPINGLWTELILDDNTIDTGFTTMSFTGDSGTQYTVFVSDYQNYLFDHWDDGSTDRNRTITPTGDMTLTASYQTGSPSDTTSPVIALNGDNPVTLQAGIDTYTEDGANVTDDDPTYTGIVSIGGDAVYANIVGTYIVTYDAPADAAGNVPAQVTRTVIVKEIVIIAETTFCDDLTIDELIASGVYNVIDNRDGHLDGRVIMGTGGNDMILASDAGNQIRARGGSDCVIGGAGNDVLYGNSGSDKIFGQQGDDLLRGNRGSDTIVGGSGDDILTGGLNTDTCISDIEDTTAPKSCEL